MKEGKKEDDDERYKTDSCMILFENKRITRKKEISHKRKNGTEIETYNSPWIDIEKKLYKTCLRSSLSPLEYNGALSMFHANLK